MMDNRPWARSPVLAKLAASFREELNLNRAALIACQHILESTHALIRSLFTLGLAAERTYILGKCYSTDPLAKTAMENDGVIVTVPSFDSFHPYDTVFSKAAMAFMDTVIADLTKDTAVETVIILDDGGFLLKRAVHLAPHIDEHLKFVGIEQTTFGYRALSTLSLPFPILNVARSPLKMSEEAAIVGDVVWRSTLLCLSSLQFNPRRALIIGNGVIGGQVGLRANQSMQVDYCDIDARKASITPDALPGCIGGYELVIGTTGTPALDLTQVSQPDHPIVFVSSSSSDVEFIAHRFRRTAEISTDWRKHVKVGNLILLASGFPINFFFVGRIPEPESFKLTRCLLLAAIYQACTESATSGFVNLSEDLQRLVARLLLPDE